MNILMMTNTYTPIIGGIERSIETLSSECRSRGHEVLIIAPEFKNMPEREENVYRLPAVQNFNGTDFSVELPVPGKLSSVLRKFKPDIVHSHHPFLVGDTAIRVSAEYNIPLVFTYHTRYEMNTHYVPGDSEPLKKFVRELASGYCSLCDQVIAPSESIAELIRKRGVKTGVDVIPTGIDPARFSEGNGISFRKKFGISEKSFLIGYLGRIAEEKNMRFLTDAVMEFMKKRKDAKFLAAGSGDLREELMKIFDSQGLSDRSYFPGAVKGQDVVNAYHAMDIFVFSSKSETQGMVLSEAMASGVPVIGVDAPGTREVVNDQKNGKLVHSENIEDFCGALKWFYDLDDVGKRSLKKNAAATAKKFDYKKSAAELLEVYEKAIAKKPAYKNYKENPWAGSKKAIKAQLRILSNIVKSAGAVLDSDKNEA
jgi:glycosyltransferase involved in cell wall biosynthesis